MEEDDRAILLQEADLELDQITAAAAAAAPASEQNGIDDEKSEAAATSGKSSSVRDRDPAGLVYLASCTAAVGGLLFGYDMGIISGAKGPMGEDLGLTCSQVGGVVALLPVGAFVASVVGGAAVDKYGRRLTIVLNAILFTVGALLVASTSSYSLILLGRFVLGFAVSLSAIAECIYISEISTPEKRGMMVGLNELGITVGILVAFLSNYIFATTQGGWRIMFGLSAAVAVGQGIAMMFLPKVIDFPPKSTVSVTDVLLSADATVPDDLQAGGRGREDSEEVTVDNQRSADHDQHKVIAHWQP